ncbi:carbohydrate kinase family protein [Kitasatospora azatica]|uniref:carbohydrate kinase family protein n=1 Tax=Kitasatospora azatica TaxID=58347 RepID=UPI00055BF21C|nr:PfkB family carbohydrate kinase [Kitasatospora azatica]
MTGDGGVLVVVGDVVTDIVARHAGPLAQHTDTAARTTVLPGGAAANLACWAASSGAGEVRLLARVGADSLDWHRDALVAAGVRPHLAVDREVPTGVVIALVDSAAERTFVTDGGASVRLGVADWAAAVLDDELLAGADWLHLSGYLFFTEAGRRVAAAAMAAARALGVPVSVDPASTGFIETLGVERFLAAVEGVDLLLPNQAEAALLAGTDDAVAAAKWLSERSVTVVVKLGPAGALAARDGALLARTPGLATTPVDSTGAGDAFDGGFLAAQLTGAPLAEALAAGCRAGAAAVALIGGRPPIDA